MTEPTDSLLEDRLSRYGRVLDRHIDEAPPSHLHDRRRPLAARTMLAVAAAAVLLVVGGGVIIAALDRTEVTVAGPTDRTETDGRSTEQPTADEDPGSSIEPSPPSNVEPAPDPVGFPGIDRCAETFGSMRDESGGLATPPVFDPRTEVAEVVILALPASPAAVQVLLLGPGGFYSCETSRTGSTIRELSAGTVDPRVEIEPTQILLVDQTWSSATDEGTTGPGSIRTVARVGPDVASAWVVLADGTALPGLIDRGWLTIDGDIPRDVPLFAERYFWRLADGTIGSARADQLDQVTPAERCAETIDCVEQRLLELQQTAADEGLEQQAAALADGWIDPEEQRMVVQATVECLNDAGFTAEASPSGLGMMVTGQPDDPDTALDAQAECGRLHNDLVSELQRLLDARARAHSPTDLLTGVDLLVEDRDGIVRRAVFFHGVEPDSLEADTGTDAETDTATPPLVVSFSLALCDLLPRVIVDYDGDDQAVRVETISQEDQPCQASPRLATIELHLEPAIGVRSVDTRTG